MLNFTPDKFIDTLPILAKGMTGVFIVTAVLVLTIALLNRVGAGKTEE